MKSKKLPKFKSNYEKLVAYVLTKLGVKYTYEKVKIKYYIEYEYRLDFLVESVIMVETKGYFDAADRRKHLAIKKCHPELDIRFLFMNNGRIHKLSETRYSDWCIRHGFKYHVSPKGELPEEWLKECKRIVPSAKKLKT